jgi:hypothetical protein
LPQAFASALAEQLGDGRSAHERTAGVEAVGGSPPPRAPASPSSADATREDVPLPEAMLDEIVRRVIDRLAETAVRATVERRVIDVAERLVREEIARIRALEP